MEGPTTMELLQTLVYFSHVNKKTQYDRPQLSAAIANGKLLQASPANLPGARLSTCKMMCGERGGFLFRRRAAEEGWVA